MRECSAHDLEGRECILIVFYILDRMAVVIVSFLRPSVSLQYMCTLECSHHSVHLHAPLRSANISLHPAQNIISAVK